MELISVKKNGVELGLLNVSGLDVDIGKTNDFVITFSSADWDGNEILTEADYWYADGFGEFGGRIGCITSSTSAKTVKASGYTWRGMLAKKIIEPDAGADYKIVSGEANQVLSQLISSRFGGFFVVSTKQTQFTIRSHQFKRYESLLSGIVDMLYEVGAKLDISYIPGKYSAHDFTPGYVLVQAVAIVDYSNEIEYSQDGKIDFIAKDYHMGVNHLICLGKGELRNRQVLHLYANSSGTISTTQTLFGIDEVAEIYDYSSAESLDDLRSYGISKFKEIANYKSLQISLNQMDANIGDIVGGQEQITGITLKKQIANIILKVDKKGKVTITHKVGD